MSNHGGNGDNAKNQETPNRGKSSKTQHKIENFFDMQNASRYQEDFGGRIKNFLKGAKKNGFEATNNEL